MMTRTIVAGDAGAIEAEHNRLIMKTNVKIHLIKGT